MRTTRRATRRGRCTGPGKTARPTRRWASTRAGASPPTRWRRWRRHCELARPYRSHLGADLGRHGVVGEDLLGRAKLAAFPLHDEAPKGVRGSIDEKRPL